MVLDKKTSGKIKFRGPVTIYTVSPGKQAHMPEQRRGGVRTRGTSTCRTTLTSYNGGVDTLTAATTTPRSNTSAFLLSPPINDLFGHHIQIHSKYLRIVIAPQSNHF